MDSILDMQRQCWTDANEWFPMVVNDFGYWGLCLSGEVGEFNNELKKVMRAGGSITEELRLKLSMELTDLLIYVCCTAAKLNVDLGKAYDHKREINIGRFAREPDPTQGPVLTVVQRPDGEGE